MEFQENKKKILSEDEVIAKESVTQHRVDDTGITCKITP